MSIERRGMENLKTGMGVLSGRRDRTSTGAAIGLDLGVAASVATSTGELLKMPALLSAAKGERLQRFVDRYPDPVTGVVAKHALSSLPIHVAPSATVRRRVLTY